MLNVHIEEISTQSVPKITRLVGGDEGERDEEGDDGLAEVPPRRHPDQRRQRQEVHQRHVRLERPLQFIISSKINTKLIYKTMNYL